MKRRRKGLLLSQNKRQLILYSTIIDMPYYSKLKTLLTKYEKIYESDFEDLDELDDELQKIFKYAIQEITESAEKEWYTKGNCNIVEGWPNKYERCQLCNTNLFQDSCITVKQNIKKTRNLISNCFSFLIQIQAF